VKRLSAACRQRGLDLADASSAVRAVDLRAANVTAARRNVTAVLIAEGWDKRLVQRLAKRWITQDDFLLGRDHSLVADYVVGNPPYVRLEDVPDERRVAYRRACVTMGGRADLFVGFIEMGLHALKPAGALAFICADRWMRNQYGRALRGMIYAGFSVEATVTMHDVDAFEEAVSAYPAIMVIRRAAQGPAVLATATKSFSPEDAQLLTTWATGPRRTSLACSGFSAAQLPRWFRGDSSWPDGSPSQLTMLAQLEASFPALENAGARVGIGVATGADDVFVTTNDNLVEQAQLLPLSTVRDTRTGHFTWSGHFLVDPWGATGELVDLEGFPRLRAHFIGNADSLRRRNVATRRPTQWFRTIDRVDHSLTDRAKLLLPDMKLEMTPVLESGGFYPHHNLYYVVSDEWPLEILGGLLMSRVAELFVSSYAVKMRGGTLRFQAQYLRRVRIPLLADLPHHVTEALADAFHQRDRDAATNAALDAYGLDARALEVLGGRGSS
jgi:hypothetical protein